MPPRIAPAIADRSKLPYLAPLAVYFYRHKLTRATHHLVHLGEYVTCHTCKSPDTILSRENRLFFMTCETCGARQSVASVQKGFSALTGKRSRIRAAAGN